MTIPISTELALLAVAVARYEVDDSPESQLCMRHEVESMWEHVRRRTQRVYDEYLADARAEFRLQLVKDLGLES